MHLLYTNLFLRKINFDNFSEKFSKMSTRIAPAFSSTTVHEKNLYPNVHDEKKCENYKSQSLKNWFSVTTKRLRCGNSLISSTENLPKASFADQLNLHFN